VADLSNDNLSHRAKRISTPLARDTDIFHFAGPGNGASFPVRFRGGGANAGGEGVRRRPMGLLRERVAVSIVPLKRG
jgi:hypothetical protein